MSYMHRDGVKLSAERIGYRYNGTVKAALSDVSIVFESGSCCGILGPNGAGKTTLLSLLVGVLPIQRGSLSFGGEKKTNKEIKSSSAIVPQDYAFYPSLTGKENLDFFSGLYGLSGDKKKSRINDVVDVCGLADVLDKYSSQYSGGIKRRLNLAIGLLSDPDILYLDEPTVGIDAQSRRFILSAINNLKAKGKTIVYTSHYMEEIEAICDDIVIIDHGKLLLQKKLSDILGGENDKLVKVTSTFPPSVAQIEKLGTLSIRHISGCEFSASANRANSSVLDSTQQIFDSFNQCGLEVGAFSYGADRLEDIYLSLTKEKLRD
ncbi:MAG: ABC transporter ATP-binding protein [Cellvibrionaceae bacterium]